MALDAKKQTVTLKEDLAVSRIKQENGKFKVLFSAKNCSLELCEMEPEAAFLMERITIAGIKLAQQYGINTAIAFQAKEGTSPFAVGPIEKEVSLIEEEENASMADYEPEADDHIDADDPMNYGVDEELED